MPGPRLPSPRLWSIRRNWFLSFQSFPDRDIKYLHSLPGWGWESWKGGQVATWEEQRAAQGLLGNCIRTLSGRKPGGRVRLG